MSPLIPMTIVPAREAPRPKNLNFQVNDVCNARCVMCHVWKHKRTHEMSPAEFRVLLADPYFSELEHVGITGGEPTLRRDLSEYYFALADACPRLKGASFITHGLDTDRALSTYTRVFEAYRARGLEFHGMVSLDGIGDVHDRIRGRSGAFDRATSTLFGLKASGIATSACCTIVRGNVWDLWNLLEWGYDKTYIRFRVAEFINRLSNHDATREIRAFDDAERSALIAFFQNLIQSYELDESVRRTYASIISLLAGGSRLVGCPYQDGRAMNLDCRGEFAVCAPKGTPHPLGANPAESVASADGERRTIIASHCPSCIHDYHDDWRPDVAKRREQAARATAQLASAESAEASPAPELAQGGAAEALRTRSRQRVLVLGWYGTETIGDLAILLGLAGEYRQENSSTQFVVPSQFPDYTRHNLRRIGLDAIVTEYGDTDSADLWGCDTVIIGGGPLMDIPQLAWLATLFERARAHGCRTIVEGCGVGPVNLPQTAADIRRIAAAADEIRLRDGASANFLRSLGVQRDVTVVDDPAARWVRSTGVHHDGGNEGPIRVFARELTHEYPQATTPAEATEKVAAFLKALCDWFPERPVELRAMHHFPVGGDDRVYARRLATILDRRNCHVDEVPRTPRETLDLMATASFVVCMRFHSLVFAHEVGAPLLAIDYTGGGKVASYVRDHGLETRRVAFADLAGLDRQRLLALGAREEPALR